MSLYLAVFEGDVEIDGIDVGGYADFDALRSTVSTLLEQSRPGSRFPVLMLHSDCDGEWSATDSQLLAQELRTIALEFGKYPPSPYPADWQVNVARSIGLRPATLCDCYLDVDGESLLDRMIALSDLSHARGLPILLQ